MTYKYYLVTALLLLCCGGCSPSVKLQAPEEPININLNVKIEHDVRVRVERDLEQLFNEKQNLF